jgi:N,N-dimethylformamidase
MLPLAAYADRLSARPGETLRFHASNATGQPVAARIVRVHSADPNPAGQGIVTTPVETLASQAIGPAPVDCGSYVRVEMGEHLRSLGDFTIIATLWPTLLGRREQPIVSWLDPAAGTGAQLIIDVQGRLAAAVGLGAGRIERHATVRVIERQWLQVWCTYEAATGALAIGARALPNGAAAVAARTLPGAVAQAGGGDLAIGASPAGSFNGKLERPLLFGRALAGEEVRRVLAGETVSGLVAAWDFAIDMPSTRIVDTGPHGLHGTTVNRPTRAMTGSTWTGREMCWRHAPDQYGAIHFHDDDIDDCRWPVAFEWHVPDGLPSGCYALLLDAGDAADNVPFFVVPPKGTARADVAVLISTYTYTIYANHARPEWTRDPQWKQAWIDQARAWGGYPHNPGEHTGYGLSTYNFHTDGSGIAYSTWHRPMLNLRIGYVTYPDPQIRASGLRHYPADLHLIAWLEAKGIAYDVVTDVELHAEGQALLAPYAALLTGSHPEYHTTAMLDALEGYRDSGGRLLYLGGNGFYWKIALDPERPGIVEIRRGEGGIRAWAAEVGEYYNAFDGEYGGLWRRNARPPQKLVGVGFTAQGNFVGSHYRVRDDAHSSRFGWMLEGITTQTFGGYGFSGHGAAGFELDRADKRLGTPAHAVVLAASEGHKPEAPWVLVPEEQLTHIVTWAGEPASTLIRADITAFETPRNGCVFAVGSITFCGALPANGFDNDVSRLLENVVKRFADRRATFQMPVD